MREVELRPALYSLSQQWQIMYSIASQLWDIPIEIKVVVSNEQGKRLWETKRCVISVSSDIV